MVKKKTIERRTGKSFRLMCQALLWASKGKRVFYWTACRTRALFYLDMALGMARSYTKQSSTRDPSITFENGGEILFISIERREDFLRGLRDYKEVYDD